MCVCVWWGGEGEDSHLEMNMKCIAYPSSLTTVCEYSFAIAKNINILHWLVFRMLGFFNSNLKNSGWNLKQYHILSCPIHRTWPLSYRVHYRPWLIQWTIYYPTSHALLHMYTSHTCLRTCVRDVPSSPRFSGTVDTLWRLHLASSSRETLAAWGDTLWHPVWRWRERSSWRNFTRS